MNIICDKNLKISDTFSHNNGPEESSAQNCKINYQNFKCIETEFELNLNNNRIESINETIITLKDTQQEEQNEVKCLNTSIHSNNSDLDINKKCIELSVNLMKRNIDINYDKICINNNNKRFKLSQNNNGFELCHHLSSHSLNVNNELSFESKTNTVSNNSSISKNLTEEQTEEQTEDNSNKSNENSDETVPQNESNCMNSCHIINCNDLKPKKTPKQVKWKQNIVNEDFNCDSLSNVLLSQTYYYYGIGIVTGEQGSQFGGNRFYGFSRHLFSDELGITVELCKPFIINRIILELENKTFKKSPLFSYKVLIAIDECMTDWHLIKDCADIVCFGEQNIHFYPRIAQYIRIIGNHGLYYENDRKCDARYFTILNFDCIFDSHLFKIF